MKEHGGIVVVIAIVGGAILALVAGVIARNTQEKSADRTPPTTKEANITTPPQTQDITELPPIPTQLISIENAPEIDELAWSNDGNTLIALTANPQKEYTVGEFHSPARKAGIGMVNLLAKNYTSIHEVDTWLNNISVDNALETIAFTEVDRLNGGTTLHTFSLKENKMVHSGEVETFYSTLSLSPDGQHLFIENEKIPRVLKRNGTELKTFPDVANRRVVWAPDSTTFLHLREHEGWREAFQKAQAELWKARTASTTPTSTKQNVPSIPDRYGVYEKNIIQETDRELFSLQETSLLAISTDGTQILFTGSHETIPGTHIWVYNTTTQQKTMLTTLENENIIEVQWAEDDSGIIALRENPDRKAVEVVVVLLNTKKTKVYPLKGAYETLTQIIPGQTAEGKLWLSPNSTEARFFMYNLNEQNVANIGPRFFIVATENMYDEATHLNYQDNLRNITKGHSSETGKISFDYPATWGNATEQTNQHGTYIDFSKRSNSITITTVTKMRDYLRALKATAKTIEDNGSTQFLVDDVGRSPLPWGWQFKIHDIPDDQPIRLRGASLRLQHVSLLDPDTNNEAELLTSAKVFQGLLTEGNEVIDESLITQTNEGNSLVGITFLEKQLIGPTFFINTIYTTSEIGERVIFVKTVVHVPEQLSTDVFNKGPYAVFEQHDIQENQAFLQSITPTTPTPPQLSQKERETRINDVKKKYSLHNLTEALRMHFRSTKQYPSTTQPEKLTKETIENSIFYNSFMNPTRYIFPTEHNPWDLDLPPGEYIEFTSNGTSYTLTATLGNSNDPECIIENGGCIIRIENGDITTNK